MKNKVLLGIESSGKQISVAIMNRNVLICESYLDVGQQSSSLLLSTIDSALKISGLSKKELEGICVSLGPGSFTSLRISIATAEALSIGLNIPTFGVDTLRVIASNVLFVQNRICVALEAYRGEFYRCFYNASNGVMPLSEISLRTPEMFFEALKDGDMVLGNVLPKMKKLNFDLSSKSINWVEAKACLPQASNVIASILTQDKPIVSKTLVPIYIRDLRLHSTIKKI